MPPHVQPPARTNRAVRRRLRLRRVSAPHAALCSSRERVPLSKYVPKASLHIWTPIHSTGNQGLISGPDRISTPIHLKSGPDLKSSHEIACPQMDRTRSVGLGPTRGQHLRALGGWKNTYYWVSGRFLFFPQFFYGPTGRDSSLESWPRLLHSARTDPRQHTSTSQSRH